jgi:hypothetical protein
MKFLNRLERINFDFQHFVSENFAAEVFKISWLVKMFRKLFLTL